MLAAIAFIAEERIRAAQREGAFDNLPGKGQPLDLEEDAHVPEELRMAWKILKNGGYLDALPQEGQATMESGKDLLAAETDANRAYRRMLKLQVLERRMQRDGHALAINTDSPYFGSVVDRVPLNKP